MTASEDFDPSNIAHVPTTTVHQTHKIPIIHATPETVKGFGYLVDNPDNCPIEIVRWPAQGWRKVDENSGDQGGTTEGLFEFWWKGDTLYARNNAVGDNYLFAWSQWPDEAVTTGPAKPRDKALVWHANYHPDGGQMFFPLDAGSFTVPAALPGDDVKPEDFVGIRVEGGKGLYIHPNIWHGAVIPLGDAGEFLDRQGKVHARVSVDLPGEFGRLLEVSLQ